MILHANFSVQFCFLTFIGWWFNGAKQWCLILAIQAAGVERGRNGFHKQKAGEKLPESEENLLQHRTDGSDAFDTLYIGCEKFPQADTSYVAVDVNGIV